MKTVIIAGALLHLAESKAKCPYCEKHIPFSEIEDKWINQPKPYIRLSGI